LPECIFFLRISVGFKGDEMMILQLSSISLESLNPGYQSANLEMTLKLQMNP
jgi:hypothetical protein